MGGARVGKEAVAVAKARQYRGEPYWLREEPAVTETERVRLRFFRRAGKLQVATLVRSREGRKYCAKAVTLDQEDLALHPEAAELLERVLRGWRWTATRGGGAGKRLAEGRYGMQEP